MSRENRNQLQRWAVCCMSMEDLFCCAPHPLALPLTCQMSTFWS